MVTDRIKQQTIVGTLQALFPDNQVEVRSGAPTMWQDTEMDSTAIFAIASVAAENKLGFTMKRSGKSIRVILK